MTRIDEALRRVSVVPGVEPGSASMDAPIAPPSDHDRLQQYPVEECVTGVQAMAGAPAGSAAVEIDGTPPPISAAWAGGRRGAPRAIRWRDKLVTSDRIPELAIEQYRRLAAAIHDLQVKHGLKTVMVTSALPEDGKTLTVVNLALTLSESYARRVLLVDADLRHPSLQDVFGLPDSVGLGGFLRSEEDEPRMVDVTGRLSVLPAGRADPNPMAALTSARMKTVLECAAARFDWVLVDTPPLALLPDGQLLGPAIKAVIFVIGAGRTPWSVVDKVIAELGREYVIGTVLNGVEEAELPATSYYRRYYGAGESPQRRRSARSGA